MRYVANPVVAEAFRIDKILYPADSVVCRLQLEDGRWVEATAEMLARISPVPGDYWVIQPDGYTYLNPKSVFEKKYSPEKRNHADSA